MTRKDYELIARVLASLARLPDHADIVDKFTVALKADNSQFNAAKFTKAANAPQSDE